MSKKQSPPQNRFIAIVVVILVIGVALGYFSVPAPGSPQTVTRTSVSTFPVTTQITSTQTVTNFSVSEITLPQQTTTTTADVNVIHNFTMTVIEPPTTTTQTTTTTTTSTETKTTVIIVTESSSQSSSVNGQVQTSAYSSSGPTYPGQNATVFVTVINGVNQILNMTFKPTVSSYLSAAPMSFYPKVFSRIVPPGSFTFNFTASIAAYPNGSPSLSYMVQIPESFMVNGVSEGIQASAQVTIYNPLTVSPPSFSGVSGTCTQQTDANAASDYICSLTGQPNTEGTATWTGTNEGSSKVCMTWQTISPIVAVILNSQNGASSCQANGEDGLLIYPGNWSLSFTLGVPANAPSDINQVEFIWY